MDPKENTNTTAAAATPEPTMTLTMTQFKEAVADNFRALIKDLGLDKIDMRHAVFPGQDTPEALKKSAHDRNVAFMQAIVSGDIRAIKDMNTRANLAEGTGNVGGYLVPDEFLAEVLRLIPEYGNARRLCRVIGMNTDSKKIPSITTNGITAYWPGEAGAITASQPVFGEVALAAKKAAIIVPSTSELLEDTNLLIELLTQMAAEQFAYAEDYQLWQGAGSSPAITGVFKSANVTKVTMGTGKTSLADMAFTDIIDMENAVAANYLRGAQWVMHRTAFKYVRYIKDDAGKYIYERVDNMIDEFPYTKDECAINNPTTANKGQIALGNFKVSHVFGDRRQMTLYLLREGTVGSDNLGEKDMVGFRFTERVDIQEAQPSAVAVLWTAAS
jgi:HK97 family phage major capsid protein